MNCMSYTNNHTSFTEKIPVPLQRLRMNEYCKQTELQPRYDHLELYTLKHFPVLIDLLQITKNVDLIMFSILSLPENQKLLDEVVKISIENKIKIHFANENLVLEDLESWENIQKHLAFR